MLVSKSISNLVNGISQQPDSLRLPTQAELQHNLYSSVVEGLMDRPPSQHIAKLYTGDIGDVFDHTINRSPAERYKVLIRNGGLTVHTLAGVEKTVTTPDGVGYITTATPSTSLKAITVQDYTFVVNVDVAVAMLADTTPARDKEALIFVKAGNYGSDYKVFIDGVQKAIKTTSTTVVTDIATNAIADDLKSDLVTNLGAGWTITRYGSVISVVKDTGDFKITCEDSQGGTSLAVFKDSVQSFTSLPTTAPTDFVIKISGQPGDSAGDYYVKFVPATSGETFGEGSWEESIAPSIPYKLDPSTMPHVLIRNVDGTFTFKKATWDNLTVGDQTSVADPSFVGNTINDVFFFKNRFSLLASDAVIMSEIGQYFNFWPTTVTTVADDDRIDYTVSHTKVSILHHAVPFDEKVVLFSDQTQFILQGGATLTQKTIQVDPTTEYENSLYAKPIGAGRNVYFVTPNGQYNGVREYFIDQATAVKTAVAITAHVPKYIPSGAFKLMSSTTEDILAVITTGSTKLYLYKYFYAGDQKLQSSWSDDTLGTGTILGGDFIESILYLSVQRSDGVYLEKLDFSAGATDPGVNFTTHYDRRITEAACSVSYNGGLNETTWTLPYAIDSPMRMVTRVTNPGQEITLTYQSGATIKAAGDQSAKTVYIGEKYTRTYRFSKFYVREENKEGKAIVLEGRLQLRKGTLAFANTGTFTVTITPDHRDPNTYVQYRDPTDAVFTGRILGESPNLLGAVALASGEFSFPILSQNTKVTIEISTDSFLPMRLLSLDWEGFFTARSQRM